MNVNRPLNQTRIVINVMVLWVVLCTSFAEILPAAPDPPKVSSRPLVIYYSRLGTTRTIAREMARTLACDIEEVISNENRHGLWTVNCVFDQLFDWDDAVVSLYHDVSSYNPIIIAGPIWIHRFATPLRTLLKMLDLRAKDVYVLVTNQGNYSAADEKNVRDSISQQGAVIKGFASIMTRNKTETDLQRETHATLAEWHGLSQHRTQPHHSEDR